MATDEQTIRVYRELAEHYERQRESQMRDRFLVLAADAAQTAGRADESERIRIKLLQFNPHHLLKPFDSFGEAMNSNDVQNYVAALRRTHSPETAARLLETVRPVPHPAGVLSAVEENRPAPAQEGPKVYRVKEESKQPRPAPMREAPVAAPTAAAGVPRNAMSSKRPAAVADVYSPRPEAAPQSRKVSYEDEEEPTGGWVGTILFTVVLICGLTIAVYALGSPFLPPLPFLK